MLRPAPPASPSPNPSCRPIPPRLALSFPVQSHPAHLSFLAAEKLVEAKLEDVKLRLCSQFGAKGRSAITEGLFLRSQEAASAV